VPLPFSISPQKEVTELCHSVHPLERDFWR
jgi:hypothetical protein